MKISLLTKSSQDYEIQELLKACQELNIEVEQINLKEVDEVDKLQDVNLYRSSSLRSEKKIIFFNKIKNKKIIVNSMYYDYPMITYKTFQQSIISIHTNLNTINSFKSKNKEDLKIKVNEGKLKFPIIQKPNAGKLGNGISIINNIEDIDRIEDTESFIFQNFINNDGDYRVFVIGGIPIGVIKRVRNKDTFLNNISKGAQGEKVTDKKVLKILFEIAQKATGALNVGISGVDVIKDADTNKYYFLELNTVPQWQGFQLTTGINVSHKIINYLKDLSRRLEINNNISNLRDVVEDYYFKNWDSLLNNKFHFASRMYLWTKEDKYYQLIKESEEEYLGLDPVNIEEKIKKTIEAVHNQDPKIKKVIRKIYEKKYPALHKYNSLMFRSLFAKSLYEKDIKDIIRKQINIDDLITFYKELYNDTEAIKYLSTYAINFLYNFRTFMGDDFNKLKEIDLKPEYLHDIAKNFKHTNNDDLRLKIYLLTHCIIGESQFYSKKVQIGEYKKMISTIEELILSNYINISLDNKFEYLVCCKICKYEPNKILKNLIDNETLVSLSDIGNFVIDKFNNNTANPNKKNVAFSKAEHRNVLFIMAESEFNIKN